MNASANTTAAVGIAGNGKVIASALDAVELRDKPEVTEDDFLMPVPDAGAGAFLM